MADSKKNAKPKSTSRKKRPAASTQHFLDIAEIKDNTIIMKDGSLRSAVLVSSVNFALKSEEEQNAVVQGYMLFLNSLDFPLQVITQSRELNVDKYLETLKEKEKAHTNELLRIQMAGYRQYVEELVSLGEIMSKRFYVIVPYEGAQDKKKSFMSRLGSIFSPAQTIRVSKKKFQENKLGLDRHVDHVRSGLLSFGVTSVVLDTQSLIELFYNTYNPAISKNQKLADMEDLQVEDADSEGVVTTEPKEESTEK